MSFAGMETSRDSAMPVRLLRIVLGTNEWLYTSAERPIVFNNQVYQPTPLEHDEITTSGEMSSARVAIRLPEDNPLADVFYPTPPVETVIAVLFATHQGDTEFSQIWQGRILSVTKEFPLLVLNTENNQTSQKRIGLRKRISPQCPHTLYDADCRASKVEARDVYTLSSINLGLLHFDEANTRPDGWYAGGYIEYVNQVTQAVDRRYIHQSNGGTLTPARATIGLEPGQQVTLYPGCPHTAEACDSKFDNILNFGGAKFVPKKNPFGGSSVY